MMNGEVRLEKLIYNFLLKLDYPRSSIVFDVDLLGPSPQVGSGMTVPTFVIVDPDTADPLAVVELVDSTSTEALSDIATQTGAYASRLAGNLIQGFVIHVDVQAETQDKKVQFYRIWPNSTLRKLSSNNFPDFSTLQVSRKLAVKSAAKAIDGAKADVKEVAEANQLQRAQTAKTGPGAGMYLPALALLLLLVADVALDMLNSQSFMTLPYSLLAIGAAALFTLPAAIRYLRGVD